MKRGRKKNGLNGTSGRCFQRFDRERVCIMCGKLFPSTDAAHRRCDPCSYKARAAEVHIGRRVGYIDVKPREHNYWSDQHGR